MTFNTDSAANLGRVLGRIAQFGLAGFAVLLLVSGWDMNVLVFLILAVFALVLFAIIGVLELLIIRPLGRWGDDG